MTSSRFHPASAPDYLPPAQMRSLQLERLRGVLQRAFDRVELFRARLKERGLTPADIGGLVRALSNLIEEAGKWEWTDRVSFLRR